MNCNLGIYFHIPFCCSKCAYCDFCSTVKWDERYLDAYLEALIRQLGDFFLPGGHYTVDTVYIGGGTPSVMGGKRLAKLLKALGKKVTLTRTCEITVEVNPESADKALFKQLKSAGVNRISMGVQTADDGQLKRIGRIHSFEKAKEAVHRGAQTEAFKILDDITEECTMELYEYAVLKNETLKAAIRESGGLYGRQKEAIEQYFAYAEIEI